MTNSYTKHVDINDREICSCIWPNRYLFWDSDTVSGVANGSMGAVAPKRSRRGGAKQLYQIYFIPTNDH